MMTRAGTGPAPWGMVDEGWGREAADLAALSEPGNCREYVAMHHRLGVGTGDRLLDVACGSGLAIELARLRGAACCGIDASARLVAVAGDRNPGFDVGAGGMHALPPQRRRSTWSPASGDLGHDARRGGRDLPGPPPRRTYRDHGVGHLKVSPGAWVLAPLRLAAADKVANQAAMVPLGRPGAGEQLLSSHGFAEVERVGVPRARPGRRQVVRSPRSAAGNYALWHALT
jgi:SAM-dependent methyltransferase